MPKPERLIVPHYAHHVRERGVRKTPVFHEDSDYLVYLRMLKKACLEYGLAIWAYCLMTNHVHLIAVPRELTSISRALHDAHTAYATYFNGRYGYVGHMWQRRPDICVMDERHTWNAIRYVERNPVRAHMVERAEDYLWSSAAAHCGFRDDLLLSGDCPVGVIENWSAWLQIEHSEEEKRTIRRHMSTGQPWCTPEMLIQLEAMTGRNLQPRNPGRPKKSEGGSTDTLF
jgi:putative transposase